MTPPLSAVSGDAPAEANSSSRAPAIAVAPREPSRALWFTALTLATLAILAILCAWQPVDENSDFWAHAATGRWILAHGQVPRQMLFLWTDHSPWIANSWATQVLFGLFLRLGEERGVRMALAWTAIMGILACLPLLWRWRVRAGDTFLLAIFGSMGVWLAGYRFTPRPEMWSLLFLSAILLLCENWMAQDARPGGTGRTGTTLAKRCAFLAAIFAAWSNFHGLVFVGMAFLGCAAVGEIVSSRFVARGAEKSINWTPLAWLAAAMLGTLANPYGARLWGILLMARNPAMTGGFPVDEFQPLFATPACPQELLTCYVMLAAMALLAWFLAPRKRVTLLLWWLFATYLAFSSRRHIAFFALTMLVVFAGSEFSGTRIVNLLRDYGNRTGAAIGMAAEAKWKVWFARGLGLTSLLLWLWLGASLNPEDIVISPGLPRSRCQFLESHAVPPELYCDYGESSYFVWRLGETHPLFIHLLSVSDELGHRYHDMVWQYPAGIKDLNSGQINTVTLGPVSPQPGQYYPLLGVRIAYARAHWALIYADADGFVWVRRIPATRALCKALEIHLPPEIFLPKAPSAGGNSEPAQ